jgi:hypothetical protein
MAIRRLNEYQKEVETKTMLLAQQLTDRGVDIARMKVVEMCKLPSGDLASSIMGYYSPSLNAGFIRVTNDHAAFIEFGTGPLGAESPHPTISVGHKGEGWYTKADGKPMDVMYGWQPITLGNGDIIYYTEGQPAKPFMYKTALELQLVFFEVAKEVFAK